ncbi:methyl-accepting chemotaxis protein [Marinomonas sp. 15G1-11]|uniref:Methyl-accepting chemotaxis protein n=1 Tax=Marinomonas phaeophyticola TaxID=3004091 RepID=A0ABT4JTL0_9GAMM|nr:methyl-accepting chemotaxis protein [Marinomonas sp. 15G1-11]MCZ2721648.1 methyl-accepting chemotaxis protein [Marinomonas sp. 15G1-11]
MNIKTRFLFALVASVLLPVVIISSLVIVNVRDNALEAFENNSQAEIAHIDSAFSMYLNGLAEDAQYLAQSSVIKQLDTSVMTYMDKKAATMTPDKNSKVEQAAYQMMKEFGEARPDLAYVYLGMDHGGYLQWPIGKNGENYDPRIRPWYKDSINSTTPVRVPVYADLQTNTPLQDFLVRFEGKNGAFGTIGVDVTLGKLTDMVKNVKFGEAGYVMLIEDTGKVLADPSNPTNNFKALSDVSDAHKRLSDHDSGLLKIKLNGESWIANKYESPALGWHFIGLVAEDEVYAQADSLTGYIVLIAIIMVIIFVIIGFVIVNIVTKPMTIITNGLQEIASGEGDLTRRLDINSQDESGLMAGAFNQFVGSINVLVGRIKNNSSDVRKSSDHSRSLSSQMHGVVTQQVNAIDQVSTAFNEMVATANEVASNCTQAAAAADSSQQQVEQGHQLIQKTVGSVTSLEQVLNESNDAMAVLSEESKNIAVILGSIRGIAEQTNLLALNAAIEAARAGEQGRGFAVVADEVRTLAGRTAVSTEEVDKLLNRLREQTEQVAEKLYSSMSHATETVESTQQTSTIFESIMASVLTIRDMTTQIAASAEEQHLVGEEINRNVVDIHDGASTSKDLSEEVEREANNLSELSKNLEELVSRFKSS